MEIGDITAGDLVDFQLELTSDDFFLQADLDAESIQDEIWSARISG